MPRHDATAHDQAASAARQERYDTRQTELRLVLYDILTMLERHGADAAGAGYDAAALAPLEAWLAETRLMQTELVLARCPREEGR